jgi:hypothetical protein
MYIDYLNKLLNEGSIESLFKPMSAEEIKKQKEDQDKIDTELEKNPVVKKFRDLCKTIDYDGIMKLQRNYTYDRHDLNEVPEWWSLLRFVGPLEAVFIGVFGEDAYTKDRSIYPCYITKVYFKFTNNGYDVDYPGFTTRITEKQFDDIMNNGLESYVLRNFH